MYLMRQVIFLSCFFFLINADPLSILFMLKLILLKREQPVKLESGTKKIGPLFENSIINTNIFKPNKINYNGTRINRRFIII